MIFTETFFHENDSFDSADARHPSRWQAEEAKEAPALTISYPSYPPYNTVQNPKYDIWYWVALALQIYIGIFFLLGG